MIAVIISLYYRDLWNEFSNYLRNLPPDFDLFIAVIKQFNSEDREFEEIIKSDYPQANVFFVPNKGTDNGPFLYCLDYIFKNHKKYDYVLKMHTKRNHRWRRDLLNPLVGTKEIVQECLSALSNPKIGMVGSRENITDNCGSNVDFILEYRKRFDIKKGSAFVGGTMFWIKFEILNKYLHEVNIPTLISELEDGYVTDAESPTKTHALERIWGQMVIDSGYKIFGKYKKNLKVCLFSTYCSDGAIPDHTKLYCKELSTYFDRIIFLSPVAISDISINYLNKNGIELVIVPNKGKDFGAWHNQIYRLSYASVAGLINDSCIPFRKLDEVFSWFDKSELDYGGLTDSIEPGWTGFPSLYHVQSYFLLIKSTTISTIQKYFHKMGVIQEQKSIISDYEVGLSQFLLRNEFKIGSMFSYKDYGYFSGNITIDKARELIKDGFPMIKRRLPILEYKSLIEANSSFDLKLIFKKKKKKKLTFI